MGNRILRHHRRRSVTPTSEASRGACWSVHLRSAIDHQRLARDEVALRRAEKHRGADDVLRKVPALDRAGLKPLLVQRVQHRVDLVTAVILYTPSSRARDLVSPITPAFDVT